eukprot:1146967-Pelagomonas_calceolata.AAC.1
MQPCLFCLLYQSCMRGKADHSAKQPLSQLKTARSCCLNDEFKAFHDVSYTDCPCASATPQTAVTLLRSVVDMTAIHPQLLISERRPGPVKQIDTLLSGAMDLDSVLAARSSTPRMTNTS